MAVGKFSKWIEARPIVNIRYEEVVSFFTDIIYRFGIPNTIITNNNTYFTGKKFLNFCDDNNIRVDLSAVAHPNTNRQVERANGMILQGLKPRIFKHLESEMGGQASKRAVESTHHTVPSHRIHAFLHGAWLRSGLAHGHRLRQPVSTGLHRGRQPSRAEDAIDQLDEVRDVALLRCDKYQ
jgi:hypothetical protein